MFDEETGEPIKARSGEGYDLRRGKTPCEASIGCAKGHYNEKPDLNAQQRSVIDLYNASRASGGSCLTESERRDWWLAETFGKLYEIDQRIARQETQNLLLGASTAWLKTRNAE